MFDPSSVPQVPLGDAVEVRMGRQRAPRFAGGPDVVPYLRAANVKDGWLELHDVLEMNFAPTEQVAYALSPGDVLVTEGCGSLAQLGASARWDGQLPGVVCFQNTLIRLRAKAGVTMAAYVHHLARYAHSAGWWASIASGTNIFHIGATRADRLPVPLPSTDAQASVAETLDAIDGLTAAANAEVAALARFRSAMLVALLNGSLSIPASYDRFLDEAA
jgi:type I restriction enzyme S subunit